MEIKGKRWYSVSELYEFCKTGLIVTAAPINIKSMVLFVLWEAEAVVACVRMTPDMHVFETIGE